MARLVALVLALRGTARRAPHEERLARALHHHAGRGGRAHAELAGTGPHDLVVDLGSGDGRIVIIAAQRSAPAGLGIELDDALVEMSRENARAPASPTACASFRAMS